MQDIEAPGAGRGGIGPRKSPGSREGGAQITSQLIVDIRRKVGLESTDRPHHLHARQLPPKELELPGVLDFQSMEG